MKDSCFDSIGLRGIFPKLDSWKKNKKIQLKSLSHWTAWVRTEKSKRRDSGENVKETRRKNRRLVPPDTRYGLAGHDGRRSLLLADVVPTTPKRRERGPSSLTTGTELRAAEETAGESDPRDAASGLREWPAWDSLKCHPQDHLRKRTSPHAGLRRKGGQRAARGTEVHRPREVT